MAKCGQMSAHVRQRDGKVKKARTEDEARSEARWIQRHLGFPCAAYRCDHCPAWHIGRSGRKSQNRRRYLEIEFIELGERVMYWMKREL